MEKSFYHIYILTKNKKTEKLHINHLTRFVIILIISDFMISWSDENIICNTQF